MSRETSKEWILSILSTTSKRLDELSLITGCETNQKIKDDLQKAIEFIERSEIDSGEKVCRRCNLPLPKTEGYFYQQKHKDGHYTFRSTCKECMKDQSITYFDKHRGEILDKAKLYRKGKK